MNAKCACLVALVISLAGAGTARAQLYGGGPSGTPESPPPSPPPLPAPGPVAAEADGPVPLPTGPHLSDYILGPNKADCCGPVGGDGPIATELYLRWGPSVNLMNGFLAKTLETGWEVQGGGRALFFNPAHDGAWTVDLGLSDVANQGQHSDRVAILNSIIVPVSNGVGGSIPTRVFGIPVTVRNLNRTYANLALGREWYIWAPGATCPTCGRMGEGVTWRVGCDAGGRWGSEKMQFHEIAHRTEVIEAAFVSLHTDMEVPCGGWVFLVGGRVEWDNTWMHSILQDVPENLQNINVMMTLGVRY
ncbi:MAG TPA: hypothetical protein VKA46_41955 [Gemmataceae bacterium]|nr:hypothetical protein [Gemmataceae bacterium]